PSTWSVPPSPLWRDLGEPGLRHPSRSAGTQRAEPMSVDVVMPRLSDSMEEGTILKWLKSPGDEVALGDELVEIETDKANMVYEAPDAGSLNQVLANEVDPLPIGEVIARVGEAGEAPSGKDGGASVK